MKYLILALTLFAQVCFADCTKPVTYLKEGQPASCTGYLFTPEQEEAVRGATEKLMTAQIIIVQQNNLIDNQDKRIALEAERYANIKSALDNQNNISTLERIAWFAAGILVTGGIVYVSNK